MSIWQSLQNISEDALRIRTKSTGNFPVALPTKQVSAEVNEGSIEIIRGSLSVLNPGYEFEVVPIIRRLKDVNPDVSQAFKDVIALANTGYKLVFDGSVSPEQQVLMRQDLVEASRDWVTGAMGMTGIINRMFAQLLVGGAIANEWVPNFKLDSIEKIKFLFPENIRFGKAKGQSKYQPYQLVKNPLLPTNQGGPVIDGQYIKLNDATFKYSALHADAEMPYGIPPYLGVITPVGVQTRMQANIDSIISNIGILGWVEALMEKPDQNDGESEKMYRGRLNTILQELKERAELQLRDGISVGFKEDHEFKFESTDVNADGLNSLWSNNEQQIASALDFDAAFMGRSGDSSETHITILFTKMLSQLTNMQRIVADNLTYGLDLFFRLRGHKFTSLQLEFNRSTITDELKFNQAMEIRQRVALYNYGMGTIDSQQYAEEMGFEAPDQTSPRIPIEILLGKVSQSIADQEQQKKDNESGQKSRDARKEQGTRRTSPTKS